MKIEQGSFGTFVQKVNPITGRLGWELEDDDYDYHQEIARSMYADMLHDHDRNKKYYVALKKAIDLRHSRGEKAHVLDIGTGTGLLSMMAAKCGADSIVACEGFPPIAEVAKKIVAENSMADRIKIVSKRSTDLKVGPGLDLEHRANILVTEVFDTELIGEGAVETYNHANEHLLEHEAQKFRLNLLTNQEGSILVPWSSDVYAVLLDSKMLSSFNRIESSFRVNDDSSIVLPQEMTVCPGNAGVHDLQVSEVPRDGIKLLSEPLKVFKFDFFKPICSDETTMTTFRATADGQANVVCVYWTLDMDQNGQTVVSCSPKFVEPSPWRDHWMQAVYHVKDPMQIAKGDELELISKHDQFSMWFDVHKTGHQYKAAMLKTPACSCGLHSIASRTRIYSMNDLKKWSKYLEILKRIKENETVLFIGDTSLLPLAAAKMGAQIDVVLAEPYFRDAIFPWDNMRFWYQASRLAPKARIYPGKMKIFGLPMQFKNLHLIRTPLGEVEGFNMASFDDLIQSSSRRSDSEVDVQPIFEYPGNGLSAAECLFELSFEQPPAEKPVCSSGNFTMNSDGVFHGVVLWADWDFDGQTISSGMTEQSIWDMGSRQGVYFIKEPYR
ncbi:unnamed protein product [Nesidiocoris tenuis]|uniref:Protein arginine N-methyltransferase domain-containing protein n=1 Tax=Nesidiocoris tenuis TaxID=355587 RepID=A0A6H5GVM3_9HEMI|nr:unnamed protein product [Nesidiocoris tenuis]